MLFPLPTPLLTADSVCQPGRAHKPHRSLTAMPEERTRYAYMQERAGVQCDDACYNNRRRARLSNDESTRGAPALKLSVDHQSQPRLIMTATAINLRPPARLNTASTRSSRPTRYFTAQLACVVVMWQPRR